MHGNGTTAPAKASGNPRVSSEALEALGGAGKQETAPELPLIDRVRRAMMDHDLTQKEVATQSSVGNAVFNQWLQGKYQGDSAKVDVKMLKWLRGLGERAGIAQLLPAEPEYFESETGKRIINHLRSAHALQDMLAVFGVPGVGKTKAISWYQRAYSNVWLVTFNPAITGTIPVLQEIGEAVGAGISKPGQGARKVLATLYKAFRESKGLLIIDEAHHLSTNALDAIRSLHDATGIAIALVGGVELQEKIKAMPQLQRRVGLRLFVTTVLQRDIDAQLAAWNITAKESRKLLTELAKKPGALGEVTKAIRLASVLAATDGVEVSVAHIKTAIETRAFQATGEES